PLWPSPAAAAGCPRGTAPARATPRRSSSGPGRCPGARPPGASPSPCRGTPAACISRLPSLGTPLGPLRIGRTAGSRIDTQRKLSLVMHVSDAAAAVDAVYRSDWGRIVATLIRLVGDFDLAEEAAQDAFAAAVEQWPASGVPDIPRAWIIQTARHKAIDRVRRRARFAEKLDRYAMAGPGARVAAHDFDPDQIPDDRLRLIFTCCHPALAPEAQVALTLRVLGGLETDEIARIFLVEPATMAQRLVRAKAKIREAHIPYAMPDMREMPARLDSVLTVIYLIFTEGYAPSRGGEVVRTDLCAEAIRLVRLVRRLLA